MEAVHYCRLQLANRGFAGGDKVLAIGGFWGDNAASYDTGTVIFVVWGPRRWNRGAGGV